MLTQENMKTIEGLSLDELKKNIALGIYGQEKLPWANQVVAEKERRELNVKFENLLVVIESAGTKVAKFIDKLIASLTNETDKIIASNEKLAKVQGKFLFWQIITSIGLVFATVGLIIATIVR
jgi:hypothetical protein